MRRFLASATALLLTATAAAASVATGAGASTPGSTTLSPSDTGTSSVTWSGGPYSGVVPDPSACTDATCDTHTVTLNVPDDYWDTHTGSVKVDISWDLASDDFDLYVLDSTGRQIDSSAAGGTTSESVDLGQLEPGDYTVQVVPYMTAGASYDAPAVM